MRISKIALQVLAAREMNIIKSNAMFSKDFQCEDDFLLEIAKYQAIDEKVLQLEKEFSENDNISCICVYDDIFPVINPNTNNGNRPYLLFYRGDIELLNNLNNNVAVIGLTEPSELIEQRERKFVQELVDSNMVIVSGLAKGCDGIAHEVCVSANKPTIAILPSTLKEIIPAVHKKLAEDILSNGGLLVTEYYREAASRNEVIKRFVDRDGLQALFAKAIILTASYRKGQGDSGSRHAMKSAQKYKIDRYMMYEPQMDEHDLQFGLNYDYYINKEVNTLDESAIGNIIESNNPNLNKNQISFSQLSLF